MLLCLIMVLPAQGYQILGHIAPTRPFTVDMVWVQTAAASLMCVQADQTDAVTFIADPTNDIDVHDTDGLRLHTNNFQAGLSSVTGIS